MSNDLVIQLLLKTGKFDGDLRHAKTQIQDFKKNTESAGSVIQGFGKGINGGVAALKKLGPYAAAAATAIKGITTAIKQDRDSMDEWGRTVETAKGLWEGLKNSMAHGTGFSIKDIVESSRAYYDVMDNLRDVQHAIGNQLTVNNTKYEQLMSIARNVALSDVDRLDALNQANELVEQNIRLENKRALAERNAAKQALDTQLARQGIKGVTRKQVNDMMVIGDDGRFGYEKVLDNLNKQVEQAGKVTTVMQSSAGAYTQQDYSAAAKQILNSSEYKLAKALYEIGQNDENQKIIDDYYMKVANNLGVDTAEFNAAAARAQIERLRKRIMNGSGSGSGSGKKEDPAVEGSIREMEELLDSEKKRLNNMVYMSEEWKKQKIYVDFIQKNLDRMNDSLKTGVLEKIDSSGMWNMAMGNPANFGQAKLPSREDFQNATPVPVEPSTIDSWASFNETMASTSTIIANLTSTFSDSMELTTASILNMVAQTLPAISTLVTAIAALAGVEATEKAVQTSKHWIEAIAAVAALGSVVAAAISSAKKNAGKFANGGIVGGNSYTGDRLVANVNSGEMILNSTQQMKLWKQINSGTSGAGEVEFHISGTDLYGVLNNYNRKHNVIR